MDYKNIPDMYNIVSQIEAYFPLLYNAYEGGTIQAKEIIEKYSYQQKGGIHATLTRGYVIPFLKRNSANIPWIITELENDGIKLELGSIIIRAYKATSTGGIPKPKSHEVKTFITQTSFTDLLEMPLHLILLWHANHIGDLTGLSLICPLEQDVERWRINFLHPLATESNVQEDEVTDQEQDTSEDYPVFSYQPRLKNWEKIDFIPASEVEDNSSLDDEDGFNLPLEDVENG